MKNSSPRIKRKPLAINKPPLIEFGTMRRTAPPNGVYAIAIHPHQIAYPLILRNISRQTHFLATGGLSGMYTPPIHLRPNSTDSRGQPPIYPFNYKQLY